MSTQIERYDPGDTLIIDGRVLPYVREPGPPPISEGVVLAAAGLLSGERVDLANVSIRLLPHPVREGAVVQRMPFANSGAPWAIHLPPIDFKSWVLSAKRGYIPRFEQGAERGGPEADWYAGMAAELERLTPERYLAHVLAHEYGHLLMFDLEAQWGRLFIQRLKDLPYYRTCQRRDIDAVERKYAIMGGIFRALHEAVADDYAGASIKTGLPHNEFYEADLARPKHARKGGELVAEVVKTAKVARPKQGAMTFPHVDRVAHAHQAAEEAAQPGFWERIEREARMREEQFGEDD